MQYVEVMASLLLLILLGFCLMFAAQMCVATMGVNMRGDISHISLGFAVVIVHASRAIVEVLWVD